MRNAAAVALVLLATGSPSCKSSASPPVVGPVEIGSAATPSLDDAEVDARRRAFGDLLHEHWEWVLRTTPELASALGDQRHGDRWTDRSPAAQAASVVERRRFLTRFEAIETAGFRDEEALSHRLMVRNLREQIEEARFEGWLMPIDQMDGPHLELPQLVARLPFASAGNYEDYIARLRAIPGLFEQVMSNLRTGMARKLVPPRFLLERAAEQAAELARQGVEASPFAGPVEKFPDTIPPGERKRLRAAVLDAVRGQVLPAYRKLAAFLADEYAPRGRSDAGIWSLPDGAARYAFAVRQWTTTRMSPDEIHALGLREVERIEAEQAAIGAKLGFADLASFRAHIRSNRTLYARDRRDILDRYQKHTDRMAGELPRLFGRLPRLKLEIRPIEGFRENSFPAAQYVRGAQDGSRPGIVRVNTGDARKRLTVDMEAIAYHEGVPGHHLQIAIQQELRGVPAFRQHGYVGSFIEGWALYAERLGKDVGLFEDPYSDYGRLQLEMLRAIRLVVDTGLHAKKWTRDQVIRFFRDHSTLDEPSVENETDRYIVLPGQALTYKIGQLTITRLHDEARGRLGEAFDIRAFHDEVLGAGAVPLDILEQRIEAWVTRAQGTARTNRDRPASG